MTFSDVISAIAPLLHPWAKLYGDSTALASAVSFLHIGGLMFGGGRAISADAITLRASSRTAFDARGGLGFLLSSHRDVLIGLAITAISGLLMLAADLDRFATSALFWVKMGVVTVLLVNGYLLKRLERPLQSKSPVADRAWVKSRRHAAASLLLWFGSALLGVAVMNA